MTQHTDEQLMARIAQGDARAFDSLVRRHLPRAYAIARRVLLNQQDAEDAAQEAFSKIWMKAGSWQPGRAAFTTWLYRVVANAALDMARKRPKNETHDALTLEQLEDEHPNAEAALADHQQSASVRALVATLTPPQRMAITLCYFEEMSNAEAAAAMGIHLKALEGLLVRARKTLREALPRLTKDERHAA